MALRIKFLFPIIFTTILSIGQDSLKLDTNFNFIDTLGCLGPKPDTIAKIVIYDFLENEPYFPGGTENLLSYIRENIKYEIEKPGPIISFVSFIVMPDGSLQHIKIIKSYSTKFDKAIIDLMEGMPKWIPGEFNGKNVACRYTIPIQMEIK